MSALKTSRLILIPHEPELLRALIAGSEAYEQKSGYRLADGMRDYFVSPDVSPDYVARLQTATSADPWTHGYAAALQRDKIVIGACGYKGPPTSEGMVEIAYGIAPGYQGRGYATEIAQALTANAFATGIVKLVRAHTLPEPNASGRILTKCGFKLIGEVIDPDDGPVWRWEILP